MLSSTWTAQAGSGPKIPEAIKFIADRDVGGNLVTIHFGHSVDYVQYVLGYGFEKAPHALLENRMTHIKLIDAAGKVVQEGYPKTADDTIFVSGKLKNGIPLSLTMRAGEPFKGTPGLDWRIYGEAGEIRVTSSRPFFQVGYEDMKIEVHDFASDGVEEVKIPRDEFDKLVGFAPRNVGRLYRGLVEGRLIVVLRMRLRGMSFWRRSIGRMGILKRDCWQMKNYNLRTVKELFDFAMNLQAFLLEF